MKKVIILFVVLFVVSAFADVGLVVEFPDGSVHKECISINENESAYSAINKADLQLDWTSDGLWGRALCMINGVGSEPDGDVCSGGWSEYWGFSIALDRDKSWDYSPVGFNAGDCWNREMDSYSGHYCTREGDVLGLAYGPYGSQPDFFSFESLCGESEEEKTGPRQKSMLMSSRPYWRQYARDCGIEFTDMIAPQNLVKRCEEHKLELEKLTNETGEIAKSEMSISKELKTIYYTYSPEVIRSLDEDLQIFFSAKDAVPIAGSKVFVNGEPFTTSKDGSLSLDIERGEYLVEMDLPGYNRLRILFRIGI